MKKKGSITIFLALILSLILSLVCAGIESARTAAARTQILNSVDIGLYSLFGQYDQAMLEEYDLFAIDACGTDGMLNLSAVYDRFEEYMKPVLRQNSQKLVLEQGGISGYDVLTDGEGSLFYRQVSDFMKKTFGSQGIQYLFGKMEERQRKTTEAERLGEQTENGDPLSSYDSEMNRASRESQEAKEQMEEQGGAEGADAFTDGTAPADVENPIPIIKRVRKMGLLELVIPGGKSVSDGTAAGQELVSGRTLQTGIPVSDMEAGEDSYISGLLFQQYLMNHLGNYTEPGEGALKYQTEYVVAGKDSDVENLKSVAGKLLLIREGVNLASLMADSAKRGQVRALSMAIAAGFLIPPAAFIIEGALLLCWSFAESVLDVRELLDGGKVALVKSPQEWQLSLSNLPHLLEGLDSVRRSSEGGMSYEDYLQVLLLARQKQEKVMRTMDMLELDLRKLKNKENFRLDSCIVALEASVDVRANRRKTFTVSRPYWYE